MTTINLEQLKSDIVISKRSKRMTEYVGETLIFLINRSISKHPELYRNSSEHRSALIESVTFKFYRYIKTPGKLIVRGYKPKQVLRYLIQMIEFSILEYKSFIRSGDKRKIKGNEITLVFNNYYKSDIEDTSIDILDFKIN